MNEDVKRDVADVCGWIRDHDGAKPRQKLGDPEERRIARLLMRLKARCGKPAVTASTKPSDRQLSAAEEAYLEKCLSEAEETQTIVEDNRARLSSQAVTSQRYKAEFWGMAGGGLLIFRLDGLLWAALLVRNDLHSIA